MPMALLIEGSMSQNKLFSTLFARNGFNVSSIRTIEEAYTQPAQAVSLVVYVWGRGGLDEFAVKRLRNNYPTTPLIAVSAHAFSSERIQALAAGFDDYLVMPFSVEDFDITMNGWTRAELRA